MVKRVKRVKNKDVRPGSLRRSLSLLFDSLLFPFKIPQHYPASRLTPDVSPLTIPHSRSRHSPQENTRFRGEREMVKRVKRVKKIKTLEQVPFDVHYPCCSIAFCSHSKYHSITPPHA
jgi:hypothetical protein